jgi:parallel beta-helix repeat protein
MKLLLFLVALLSFQFTIAATYYFSSTLGDDSRTAAQAQNSATPWRTVNKLNSIGNTLNPGDYVLLKRGDVFYGSINVIRSGVSGLPITFSAYGSGAKPVITGLVDLGNWVSVGNGVWETYNSALGSSVKTVLLNNAPQRLGRYPNHDAIYRGYLTLESFVGNTSITDNQLTSNPNWTGGEVVIRKRGSILDANYITSHSGSTINFTAPNSYSVAGENFVYFIQNHINTLDQLGEWYYNPSQKKMSVFFGGNNPSSYEMKASVVANPVNSYRNSYLVFDNLAVKGANENGFKIEQGSNISITNCDATYNGEDGVHVVYHRNFQLQNSSVFHSNNNGVNLYGSAEAIIRGNRVENTFTFAGMAKSGDGAGIGIAGGGAGNLIEYNEVINTGYIGISYEGNYATVKNNFVNRFNTIKDDGGGIYAYAGDVNPPTFYGRKVIGNIVINGIGASSGNPPTSWQKDGAVGISLDDNSSGVEIRDNTVANCAMYGIYYRNAHDIILRNNTFYNNLEQLHIIRYNTYGSVYNNEIAGNIFFSKSPSQLTSSLSSVADDINSFGSFDNNFYCRPFNDKLQIHNAYVDGGGQSFSNIYDLADWKAKYGKDGSSKGSPVQIPEYVINSVTGANQYPNGAFNSSLGGYVWNWAAANNCNISWNSGGMLDGGAARVTYAPSAASTNTSFVYSPVGAINSQKHYRLKFSLVGSKNNISLGVFLRNGNDPYNKLTNVKYCKISTSRTENEMVFSLPGGTSNAHLVFETDNEDFTYWFDNVELNEVDVSITNPDDHIRFEYNPSTTSKTVSLNGNYIDAKSNVYSNSIVLAPYSSAVLIKQGPAADITPPTIVTQNITVQANSSGVAAIQASDVISSITDNSGVDNSSILLSTSQFNCPTAAAAGGTSHQAYIAPITTGNDSWQGELGMEFRVNNSSGILIKQLGAFDHQGNGITGTQSGGVRVAIYNKATRTIVPGLDAVIIGNADAYMGNHRMKNITPVTLLPGNYVVVAKGYHAGELYSHRDIPGTPVYNTDNGNGAISFIESSYSNNTAAGFNYPQYSVSRSPNLFLAGTFIYETGAAAAAAGGTSHQAYIAPITTGNDSWQGELGMEFRVNNSSGILIKQLGAFDHQGNGITGTQSGGVRVAIYNKATRTIVPGLDAVIIGNADAYMGNHRMKNITPVTLLPGNYVVVAKGYHAGELYSHRDIPGTPVYNTDNGNGAISFIESSYSNNTAAGFNYPQYSVSRSPNLFLAGTFIYETGAAAAAAGGTSHQAYIAPITTGNDSWQGELGMEFRVNNSSGILIKQLGAFDHQGNGITGTQSGGVRVAIYNKATRTIVPGLDAVIIGNADAYMGNHRMKNITPVTLLPGNYVVVAKGYHAGELYSHRDIPGTPVYNTDNGNGAISFIESSYSNNTAAGFNYPQYSVSRSPNLFLAGTFIYETGSSGSAASTNTYIVTVSAKDIYGNAAQATATVTVICGGQAQAQQMVTTSVIPGEMQNQRSVLSAESITGLEKNAVTIFPNPTSGKFSLRLTHFRGPQISVQIFNGGSKMVANKTVSLNGSNPLTTIDFNLSNQASGLYFIKITSADGVQSGKLVIQR